MYVSKLDAFVRDFSLFSSSLISQLRESRRRSSKAGTFLFGKVKGTSGLKASKVTSSVLNMQRKRQLGDGQQPTSRISCGSCKKAEVRVAPIDCILCSNNEEKTKENK